MKFPHHLPETSSICFPDNISTEKKLQQENILGLSHPPVFMWPEMVHAFVHIQNKEYLMIQ